MFSIGIVGCGRISKKHLNAIVANRFNLLCICDKNLAKAEKLAENYYRLTSYKPIICSNINKLLTYDLDLVAIITDSGSHYKLAKKCLISHKNTLVEKPLALATREAKELDNLAKQNRCFLGVCYQKRYNRPIMLLMKAIKENRFGRIFSVDIQTLWHRDNNYYESDKWRGTWKNDGGSLMNQTIHNIDIALKCIPSEPQEVFSMINNFNHQNIETEDYGTILVKFEDGSIVTIKGTVDCFSENYKETLLVMGENGLVEIGGVALDKVITWKFKDSREYDKDVFSFEAEDKHIYGNGHILLYKNIYDSIINNKDFEINALEASKSLNIVLAAYKSALTHKIVHVNDFSFSSKNMNYCFK